MRTNTRTPLLLIAVSACVLGAGCYRQQMADHPGHRPLAHSEFFADGRASRALPAGTVARDFLLEDDALFTGKVNGQVLDRIPVPVTAELVDRGQNRFNIFCAPCHDRTGSGKGMAVLRGFKRPPPSYHIDRLREIQDGHFFDVMTNGFGGMPDYSDKIAPRDRWAIVAYVRALQVSRMAKLEDVPAEERQKSGEWK